MGLIHRIFEQWKKWHAQTSRTSLQGCFSHRSRQGFALRASLHPLSWLWASQEQSASPFWMHCPHRARPHGTTNATSALEATNWRRIPVSLRTHWSQPRQAWKMVSLFRAHGTAMLMSFHLNPVLGHLQVMTSWIKKASSESLSKTPQLALVAPLPVYLHTRAATHHRTSGSTRKLPSQGPHNADFPMAHRCDPTQERFKDWAATWPSWAINPLAFKGASPLEWGMEPPKDNSLSDHIQHVPKNVKVRQQNHNTHMHIYIYINTHTNTYAYIYFCFMYIYIQIHIHTCIHIQYLYQQNIYIYIHIHIFVYIYIHIQIHVHKKYVYIHTGTYTYIHTSIPTKPIYIYIHIHIFVYIYLYICIYRHLYIHKFISIFRYIYIYIHICVYVCMYVRTYVCRQVGMYVCMHVCMYVCMHTCIHTYIYI